SDGDRRRRLLPGLRSRGLRHRGCRSGGRRSHPQPPLTRRRIGFGTLALVGAMLVVLTAAILWIVPSDSYLFLPDTARPVAPLVRGKGGKDPGGPGGVYSDPLMVRRAKLFEQLSPFVHRGETLVPARAVNPPGVSDSQTRAENLREMARSQD